MRYKSATMNINVVLLLLKVVIHKVAIVVIPKNILGSQQTIISQLTDTLIASVENLVKNLLALG